MELLTSASAVRTTRLEELHHDLVNLCWRSIFVLQQTWFSFWKTSSGNIGKRRKLFFLGLMGAKSSAAFPDHSLQGNDDFQPNRAVIIFY
jgi:hypothetical protein